MSHPIKTAAAGLVAAGSLLAVGHAPAGASEGAGAAAVNVASTVTYRTFVVDEPNVTFKGAVSSKKPFCEDNRKITLKQLDQGVVAGRTSSDEGKWRVTFDGTEINPGKFRLIMEKRTVKRSGKTFVCSADTHTFTVEG